MHSAPVASSRPATSVSAPAPVHGTLSHEVSAPVVCYGTLALPDSEAAAETPPVHFTPATNYACSRSDHLSLPDIQARLPPESQLEPDEHSSYFIETKGAK